jgi:N-acetylmuramoyl-L-alanine amidase
MSATLNNAGLELIKEEVAPTPALEARTPSTTETLGREALQALLAFSALHEQIRKRRAQQIRDGVQSAPESDWQLEHFVLDEVLQLVAERALAITGADGVAVALAEGNAIVCRASAGSIAPDPGIRLDPNSGFSGECLVSGRIVRCDDADTDSRVNLSVCRRLGVRSMLAVPLSAKQNVIGLIEAFSNEPYGFNDSDVRSLGLLAELILSAMKPEEEDRLREISRRVVPAAPNDGITFVALNETGEIINSSASAPEVGIGEKTPDVAFPSSAQDQSSSAIVEVANTQLEVPAAHLNAEPLDQVAALPIAEESSAEVSLANPESASLQSPTPTDHPVIVAEPDEAEVSSTTPESSSPQSPTPTDNPVIVTESEEVDRSRPGLVVVAAVVLFAAALGAGVWWTLGHRGGLVGAGTGSVSTATTPKPAAPAAAAPVATAPLAVTETTTEDESNASPAPPEEVGVLPEVTGIRHWSSGESSTVVIDIQDQIQYEAHRLSKPERIYFDLHDTRLAEALTNRIIPVNDALLERIRVAQPLAGVTRVVLETSSATDFSVSLEPNPYRLVIEVRKLGTKPSPRAKIDLFAPVNPAPAEQTATKQAPKSLPPADQVAGNQKPLNADPSLSAPKLRIVLDAGHGGWDLGTVGRKGLLEKDLVLDIVQRLGQLVESRLGAEVIYTRKDDSYLALEKRAEIANLAQAGLFLSVHANYSDFPSARGVETYYTNTYSSVKARTEEADEAAAAGVKAIDWTNVDIRAKVHESRRVAASIQRSLYAMLSAKNPGLPNRGVKEAHYVVLTGTSMPAILAEVSFVSSPTDENNLQSSTYRQQIAEALYGGIAHYEELNRNVKMASAAAKPTGK